MAKPTKRILDWASGGNAVDPGATKEANGWFIAERPSAYWWNWILQSFGEWLSYFETTTDDNAARAPKAFGFINVLGDGTAEVTANTSLNLDSVSVTTTYIEISYTTSFATATQVVLHNFRPTGATDEVISRVVVSTADYVRIRFDDYAGATINPATTAIGLDLVVFDIDG